MCVTDPQRAGIYPEVPHQSQVQALDARAVIELPARVLARSGPVRGKSCARREVPYRAREQQKQPAAPQKWL